MARWAEKIHEEQCRNYIANALKILTDNTAVAAGAKIPISHMTKNLSELSETKKPAEPKKSGEDIAADIIGRLAKKD